ncbi:hypothetical protein FB45DRAFT_1021871 [Roridomyces roridus]|uniref:Uncharacterized protein n=1 Tax=Roridomyces roridus TaxID=1738132 RepID=A0AAD7C790_9AGAR|nr:hypothetical protein FB45DRAFT_1021871 [Roridomyces roridus]
MSQARLDEGVYYGLPAHLANVNVKDLKRDVITKGTGAASQLPDILPTSPEEEEEDENENVDVHPSPDSEEEEDKENVNPRLEEEEDKENVDPRVQGDDKENIAPESHFNLKLKDDDDEGENANENEQGSIVWNNKQAVKSNSDSEEPSTTPRLGDRAPLTPVTFVLSELAPEPATEPETEAGSWAVYDNDKEQGFVVWTDDGNATGTTNEAQAVSTGRQSEKSSSTLSLPLAPIEERSSSPIPPALKNHWDDTESDSEHNPGFVVWTAKGDEEEEKEESRSSSPIPSALARALNEWDKSDVEDDENDGENQNQAEEELAGQFYTRAPSSQRTPLAPIRVILGDLPCTPPKEEEEEEEQGTPTFSAIAATKVETDGDGDEYAFDNAPPRRTPLALHGRVILGDLLSEPEDENPGSQAGEQTATPTALDVPTGTQQGHTRSWAEAARGQVSDGEKDDVDDDKQGEERHRDKRVKGLLGEAFVLK